jgi:putative hemolysin
MDKKIIFLIILSAIIGLGLFYYYFWPKTYFPEENQEELPSDKNKESELKNKNTNNAEEKNPILGIANPASVFCQEQGGVLETRKDKEGGEKGFCLFEDGSECDEWDFYNGKCKKGERFCKDLCGDGVCQEIVCLAVGCPCSETKESCPQDCF